MTLPALDAILIPGGGVRDGEAPPWVKNRLDRAAALHQGEFIITLSAGTVHRPLPRDEQGYPLFESVLAAKYLTSRGIDPARILAETSSYDTIGNAYFSRVIHAQPRGLKRLLVITSAFHLPRAEAIFRWVYGLDAPGFDLRFEAVENVGVEPEALRQRIEKEQASLARLQATIERIQTFAALHAWLFAEHAAYAVGALPRRASGDVVDTY